MNIRLASTAYKNLVTILICATCKTGGVYVGYENAQVFVAKTKGPLKQVRKNLQDNVN